MNTRPGAGDRRDDVAAQPRGDQPLPPRPEDRRPRPKASVAYSDRDPRLLETSAMGSLPDNKEGRDEGHEVGPGRSRGTSDERPGSDGNADLRPGPTATFCECPSETPASYIGGAPGGVYCDECDNPVRPKASAATHWYVPCGCDHHGDHLGCDATCEDSGCRHPVGVEVMAATEAEADAHVHGPACESPAATFDDRPSNLLRFYCGHHTHISLVSDGDQGECGWEGIVEVEDIEFPLVTCPKCGAELGREDVMW